jgi:hypothetical protein
MIPLYQIKSGQNKPGGLVLADFMTQPVGDGCKEERTLLVQGGKGLIAPVSQAGFPIGQAALDNGDSCVGTDLMGHGNSRGPGS